MKPTSARRRFLGLGLSALIATVAVIFFLSTRPFQHVIRMKASMLRCVKIAPEGQSTEGIGAILRRNQVALFVAELYAANLSFPNITSDHGYEVQDMFDHCLVPSDDCMLYVEDMILYRCPRADCDCLRNRVHKYIDEKSQVCRVLHIETDRVRTMEYSGCIGGVLSNYFGTNSRPSIEYDAIHYRAGDLADQKKGKSFSTDELWYLLTAMCKISTRDIYVVTEGRPRIPKPTNCGDRLVLASDTTVQEAFQIIQYAKTVAVGSSSFATMMMEVAKPAHLVLPGRVAALYEWVDCRYWTVVGERGAVFHFDSKKMMVDAVLAGAGVEARSLRTRNQERNNRYEVAVPSRNWTKDAMWSTSGSGLQSF